MILAMGRDQGIWPLLRRFIRPSLDDIVSSGSPPVRTLAVWSIDIQILYTYRATDCIHVIVRCV